VPAAAPDRPMLTRKLAVGHSSGPAAAETGCVGVGVGAELGDGLGVDPVGADADGPLDPAAVPVGAALTPQPATSNVAATISEPASHRSRIAAMFMTGRRRNRRDGWSFANAFQVLALAEEVADVGEEHGQGGH
jgi:hypothetical protein